jgi:hypothetical protein
MHSYLTHQLIQTNLYQDQEPYNFKKKKKNYKFLNYVILITFFGIETLEKCNLLKMWHFTVEN